MMFGDITMAFPVQHDTVFQTEEFFNRSASQLSAALKLVHLWRQFTNPKQFTTDATSTVTHRHLSSYSGNMRLPTSFLCRFVLFSRNWLREFHSVTVG
jgi:hypothetical protein